MELLKEQIREAQGTRDYRKGVFSMEDGIEKDIEIAKMKGSDLGFFKAVKYGFSHAREYELSDSGYRNEKKEFKERVKGYDGDKDDLWDTIWAERSAKRRHDVRIANEVGDLNPVSKFIGTTGGLMTDPIVALSMIITGGLGAVVGTTARVGLTAGRAFAAAAGTGAGVNLLTEVPIQLAVTQRKKKLGDDPRQANIEGIANVALVTAAGGLISGVSHSIGRYIRSRKDVPLDDKAAQRFTDHVAGPDVPAQKGQTVRVTKGEVPNKRFSVTGRVGNRFVMGTDTDNLYYVRYSKDELTWKTIGNKISSSTIKSKGGFKEMHDLTAIQREQRRYIMSPVFKSMMDDYKADINEIKKFEDLKNKVEIRDVKWTDSKTFSDSKSFSYLKGKSREEVYNANVISDKSDYTYTKDMINPVGGLFVKSKAAKGKFESIKQKPADFEYVKVKQRPDAGDYPIVYFKQADLEFKEQGRVPIYFENKAGKVRIINGLHEALRKNKNHKVLVMKESDGWDLQSARLYSEVIEFQRNAITPANIRTSGIVKSAILLNEMSPSKAMKKLDEIKNKLSIEDYQDVRNVYLFVNDMNLDYYYLAISDIDFRNNLIDLSRFFYKLSDRDNLMSVFDTAALSPFKFVKAVDKTRSRGQKEIKRSVPQRHSESDGGIAGLFTAKWLRSMGIAKPFEVIRDLKRLYGDDTDSFMDSLVALMSDDGYEKVVKAVGALKKDASATNKENIKSLVGNEVMDEINKKKPDYKVREDYSSEAAQSIQEKAYREMKTECEILIK